MNIFVAGASGAIGQPLIAELLRAGHQVTGLTHSAAGAERLLRLGARVAQGSALDAAAVEQALRQAQAEVVIDQLTALPPSPVDMASAAEADRRLRLDGGGNLYRAAQELGVRRYLQQSSGFFLEPGAGLADETAGLAVAASPFVSASARVYTELEARVLGPGAMAGVVMRYGFFYGPSTWYNHDGACADLARHGQLPIIGSGSGLWNWIHIDDAAQATVAALTAPPGIYHVVNDEPVPVDEWLPAFARAVGAPPPPHVSEDDASPDAVYYATQLRGASNQKARQVLGFTPRPLAWLA